MLQLYYTLGSPPSRAALQAIRVLGLEVNVKNVDLMKGENLSPEFLKLNPLHQVPVLVDGDFVITESRAILGYLVNSRRTNSSWYPADPKKRALVDKMLYFDAVNFFEVAAGILVSKTFFHLSFKQVMWQSFFQFHNQRPVFFRNETNIPADKIAKLKETLKILEDALEGELFFAGKNPTLADISILSTYIMFSCTFEDYGEIPNINAWYNRCQSLPGFEENAAGIKAIRELMSAKGMTPIPLK